jgi:hypothetical protein
VITVVIITNRRCTRFHIDGRDLLASRGFLVLDFLLLFLGCLDISLSFVTFVPQKVSIL